MDLQVGLVSRCSAELLIVGIFAHVERIHAAMCISRGLFRQVAVGEEIS